MEAELQWLHEFPAYEGNIVLEDTEGNRYPTQKLLEGSVIQGFRSKILFKASIGGLGYKTFKVIKTNSPDSMLVSSPFASETRADSDRDKPMGEWIYSHSDKCGMLVLCDSAFAYNKKGSKLAITLLRSCIYGDLRVGELDPNADYPYMQQGITEGRIRMMPVDAERKPNFADMGAQFNNPPYRHLRCEPRRNVCTE